MFIIDESAKLFSSGLNWIKPAMSVLFLLTSLPLAVGQIATPEPEYKGEDRVENWKGKSILVVTPHPDDDTFNCAGTLAKLAKNGNKIIILIYTTDNAGSNDPKMTKEKLAAIRKSEEEESCKVIGIPKENIVWLGYDDGMLEYVDKKDLTKQVAREIRKYRPDAVFSIDPGAPYDQWHKSDHRTAAFLTVDAMRAASWRLYFPDLEAAGFKQWSVPVAFLFYSAQPNYSVDIDDVADLKRKASAAHVSQFGDFLEHYDEAKVPEQRAKIEKELKTSPFIKREKGKIVEKFRRSEMYGG